MSTSRGAIGATEAQGEMPCVICGAQATGTWRKGRPAWVEVKCPRCPEYWMKLRDMKESGIVPHEIIMAESAYLKILPSLLS
jgi:hypothetical protein